MDSLLSDLGKLIYRMRGWTYESLPEYWPDKMVIIGFPHTSNMDTVMAFTYAKLFKVNARVLIKADWFFWPMSRILRSLGGIPVVRDKAKGFVGNAVQEFEKHENFALAIVPEGTRKKTLRIKTGFWNIAKGAQVPILCWFLDNRDRRTKWVGSIRPGDDLAEDLLKIKSLYQKHGHIISLGDIDQYRTK